MLFWSFAYFFFLLASYYVLRPVRDEMGVRSGVGFLPWLYTATFITSLAIAPVFAFLVARLKRAQFIPVVYGFLLLNILVFWGLLDAGIALALLAKVFFVWITVFSVFAVSVFWSFMADLFVGEQAKRLYPVIAAGGALGGVAGSATVNGVVQTIGAANLLLIAAGFLGLALVSAIQLGRIANDAEPVAGALLAADPDKTVGGGMLAGFVTILRSPYLLGIALWVLGLSFANTFAYNIQTDLMGRAALDSATRTQIFSRIDLAVNILIPLLQLTLTRFLLSRVGLGLTLGVLAIVFAVGFVSLALVPTLGVLIAFQIANRTAQFALSNPAREALWPVVDRGEKYKAKNIIDNAVFRGSDVGNAWLFKALHAGAGLSIPVISMIGAPMMALWFILSLVLGRTAQRKAATPS